MLLECVECNALVNAEELSNFETQNQYDHMDSIKYTFCKCPQCWLPLLAEQHLDFNPHLEETYWSTPIKLYPNNPFYINPAIPESLRKALLECIQCFKGNANTATAIMCRRTLEGFCVIKGAKERNLERSIKKLKDEGIINEQLYEWANQLRLVGNEAAHNISSNFSYNDAKDILDFTIAILDFTFSFKEKFDNFKLRTSDNSKTRPHS